MLRLSGAALPATACQRPERRPVKGGVRCQASARWMGGQRPKRRHRLAATGVAASHRVSDNAVRTATRASL